jgi:hypothetical protein
MDDRHLLHEFFNGRRPRPQTRATRLINAVLWLLIFGLLSALALVLLGVL